MKRRAGTKPSAYDAMQFKTLYIELFTGGGSGGSGGGPPPPPTQYTPSTPTNLTATTTSVSTIDLEWSSVGEYTIRYHIERSTDGVTFAEIATTVAGTTIYADLGLEEITQYYYRVRASSSSSYSPYSNVADATTWATPSTPDTLVATAISSSEIDLTWDSVESYTDEYCVERSDDGVTYTEIDTVAAPTKTYSDTGLDADTQYWYRVRGHQTTWNTYSPYSNVDDATTLAAFPTTGILDDFNRADGPLGANWTDDPVMDGGLLIDTNRVKASVAYSGSYWSAANFGPDCEVYFTLVTLPASFNHSFSMDLRYDVVAYTLYSVYISTGFLGDTYHLGVTKIVTGSGSNLVDYAISATDGDSFGASIVGNTITLYQKTGGVWSVVGSVTDSSSPITDAGRMGLYISHVDTRLDDFGGGTI